MSSLIQLTNEIQNLLMKIDEIEENNEQIPVELIDLVNQLVDGQADKVDRVCAFVDYSDQAIEFLKEQKKKIDLEIKRFERAQERLKNAALFSLQKSKQESINGKLGHKIYLRKSESVKVLDEKQIPPELTRSKIVIEPNKDLIKQNLKQGLDVPGCVLEIKTGVVFK